MFKQENGRAFIKDVLSLSLSVLFLLQNILSLELSSDEERDEGRRRNGSLDSTSFIKALSFLLKHYFCSQALLYVNSWDTSNKQCSEGRRRMGCKEASHNSSDLLLKVTSYNDCLTKDLSLKLRLKPFDRCGMRDISLVMILENRMMMIVTHN